VDGVETGFNLAQEWIPALWFLLWLCLWTVEDIRSRQVYGWQLWLVIAVGAVWRTVTGELFCLDMAGSMLPGAAMIVLSFATRGQIGLGDGLAVICMGLCLGFQKSAAALLLALFLSAAVSLCLMVIKKKPRSFAIPFLPFLLAGMAAANILWQA